MLDHSEEIGREFVHPILLFRSLICLILSQLVGEAEEFAG